MIPFEAPNPKDFQFRIQKILGDERGVNMSGMDIQFRRGDVRFFLLNPGRYQDCAKLWNDLFNTHIKQLRALFEQVLPKWVFLDLAMFCLFSAKQVSLLKPDALNEMLRITDTDFIKQFGPKLRSQLLSTWFETHVRAKLEQWPPA
jgi:hypothetical protein